MESAARIAGLIVKPRALADVATRARPEEAVLAFGLAGGAVTTLAFVPGFMTLAEPYRDVATYLRQAANPAWFMLLLWWSGVFAVAGMAGVRAAGRRLESARLRASVAVLLLAPVCFVVPVLAWTILRIIAQVGDPSLFTGPVPAWPRSRPVQIAASPWWSIAFAALAAALASRAWARVPALTDGRPRCRRCGYDLTGVTAAVCPECGAQSAALTAATAP